MDDLSRRSFLGRSARSVFVFSAASISTARRPLHSTSANEKVQIAAIGVGGRGSSLIRGFVDRKDCAIPMIGDLDPSRGAQLVDYCAKKQGVKPERVLDYRRVLDSKDVDAVTVATPDHWHGPMTIYACQAGKDVYVEKPPSHNVWEGRKMVEASRHHKQIVQVGTQNRSAAYVKKALEYIQGGGLGKIHLCKVYNLKSGGPYRAPVDTSAPKGLDYDTWLGPAPKRSFNRGHFHGLWHNYWRYSGGDMADDGVHQLDIARWLTGVDFPTKISGSGGNYAFDDDREPPDTQVVSFTFPKMVMTFELTQYAGYMRKTNGQTRNGSKFPFWPQNATRIELYGSKNLMIIGRHGGGWQVFTGEGKAIAQEFGRFPDPPHKADFVDAVKTRRRPNADIEEGHRSACLVHLGNISTRLGRSLAFDKKSERVVGDPEAQRLVKRSYRAPFTIPDVF
ncbi:MAG: Gfo/Idh/MocA family oxidoreductase [Planctomycetota bacterium]